MIQRIKFFLNNVFRVDISFLKKGDGPETNRFDYQKRYVDFKIKKGDKVLDVGSGGYPFPYATCIADKFLGKTTHRAEKLVRNGKKFVCCDVENMPFKDKEFDFVYCSHLLEHVNNPAKACEEIMRVGKRGYIETPTKTTDIMFNFLKIRDHHKWFVVKAGKSLVFFEYNPAEKRDLGVDEFYSDFHSKFSNPFQRIMKNNRDLFVNMFIWESRFYYYVFSKEGILISTNTK